MVRPRDVLAPLTLRAIVVVGGTVIGAAVLKLWGNKLTALCTEALQAASGPWLHTPTPWALMGTAVAAWTVLGAYTVRRAVPEIESTRVIPGRIVLAAAPVGLLVGLAGAVLLAAALALIPVLLLVLVVVGIVRARNRARML